MKAVMGLKKFLFGDQAKVKREIVDPELGMLVWSDDDEGWKGVYSGMSFLLSIERGKDSPSSEIKEYAISLLRSPAILEDALNAERKKYVVTDPRSAREVSELKYETICFYRYKSRENRIIASLGPGENFRAWRIEFSGDKCEGLGFDS